MSVTTILYTIIIFPVVQILEFTFVFFQKIFRETGLSVLGISAVITLLSLPLYTVAEKWQQIERETQKKLRPKIDIIKAVFKGDERYMILSAYYRQNHYHPVYAMRSSFGLLIQIPFFIAAYSFLSRLDALKGASFFFIKDMGVPDASLLIGNLKINILPLIMTAINCVSAALYTRNLTKMDKIQLYLMAFVFLALLYTAPSGLVIYWTMNNIFSLLKNLYRTSKFQYKNYIICTLISGFCLFLIYYILAIHKGSGQQRIVIAVFSAVIAILPWFFIVQKKLQWKVNFAISGDFIVFTVSLLALWVLIGFWIPSTLIASSPDEFSYIDSYASPVFFIANTAFQALGFFFLWPVCLYFLFSRKIKNYFALPVFTLFLFSLCNVFIFPGNYGLISISLQFSGSISHSKTEILLNLALLCVIGFFSVLFFKHIRKTRAYLIPIPVICAGVLLILSFINLSSIQKTYRALALIHPEDEKRLTEVKPLFKLSQTGKNIIIIMLDMASSSFFPFILEEDPALKEAYSGFTYYPNTVSFNGRTVAGAPPVFGGYEYTPIEINRRNTEPIVKKHNEALLMLPVLFSNAGYHVTVTDPPYPNYSTRDDLRIYDSIPNVNAFITDSVYTDFWTKEHAINLPSVSDILKRGIFWYSVFRALPPVLRWPIYQRGDWCSSIPGQKIIGMLNGYSVLDYLPRLAEVTREEINTTLIMVNNAAHEGALLQEPDYRPALNVVSYGPSPFGKETAYHINIAAFKRLADWFIFLKENEVYNNTLIILVSDHGSQVSYMTKPAPGMPENFENLNPILFVKDFNADGMLKTDNSFMTNADVPFLAISGQIENPVNPFTGKEITMEAKKNPQYIAISASIHRADPMETQFDLYPKLDFYVHDNIFEPNNWQKVEN